MSNMLALLAATGGGAPKLYADDVFQSYTRTGTGSSATVTTGIDMTKGYTLHSKGRSGATDHAVYDSARGVTFDLVTNTTAAQTTQATGLTAVSTTGHTIGALAKMNTNAATYVDWVFREAAKFHKVASVTKSSGSNATVDLSTLGTVGMVKVKRTDAAGSWYVWHRSLTAGKLLIGETTAAEATLGHITMSGTTLTLVNGVIADGTYHVEAYAHDTSADGLIQCGSFTTDASGNAANVSLGWEPQYLLYKKVGDNGEASPDPGDWRVLDVSRKWAVATDGTGDSLLFTNSSAAESDLSFQGQPNATGFNRPTYYSYTTYIYLAIRRPNKPPTVGTQVYNAIARTGTGAAATVTGVGFAPDLLFSTARNTTRRYSWHDRLRGYNKIDSDSTGAETTDTTGVTAYGMDGVSLDTDGAYYSLNNSGDDYINHFFRRAPGVHDHICYAGTGANKTEAIPVLGVPAELWMVKGRSGATEWVWGSSLLANTEKIVMPSPNGKVTDATAWNSTYPTASAISLGTAAAVNTSAATYTLYMWATLAGVSKVGTYTGDGAAGKVINCGFTAGARFVMIIRATASTAQDIFLFDTVRGIVAGNDGHLSLNTTAAEVTTDDSIDPDASGFIVNQVAATNINVSGAVYLYLAYA